MGNTSWLDDPKSPAVVEMYKDQHNVKIVEKTGWFWTTIAWLLFLGTFGRFKREEFLDGFATTIGNLVGFPRSWSYRQMVSTMPHENRHVWQGKMLGLFISPWLGLPLFFLVYVLLPIPLGFAYFRYLFERDASMATVRMRLEAGEEHSEIHRKAQWSADRVASSSYGWSVPQSLARKGYRKAVDKEIAKYEKALASK